MKKMLLICISLFMVLCLFGCSDNSDNVTAYEKGEIPEDCRWMLDGTIFPLKEEVTFNIVTQGYRNAEIEKIETNKDWKSLSEATNVKINFISVGDFDSQESKDALQIRLMGGDYGDAIWSFNVDTLSMADINELGAGGIIIPLNEYLEDTTIMPNFNKEIRENHEGFYTNMRSADGNAYYLCGVSDVEAYTSCEALMQVNSAWLNSWKETRGVDHSPETLEEFEDMLDYFKTSDLNGNGKADETPYFIAQSMWSGCATLEHAMGMYGIATKDSASDMDIQIDDNDKCNYVYTTDTYKEALKKFAEWYSKGYVWSEIFTANQDTINGMIADAANKFGLLNACENIEGFEPLLPPTINGYQARYHMHPSVRLGIRQPSVVITNKCEHPDILAAFFDLLLNFDNYMLYSYGSYLLDNGGVDYVDGKYVINDTTLTDVGQEDYPISYFLYELQVKTQENFNEKVDIDSYFGNQARVRGYLMYEDKNMWNPTNNLWPRCSLLEEDAEDYAFKYTDVSTTVAEYRAKFVTGQLDIDSNWDEFQNKLVKLGVNDMRDAVQRAYEAFENK